jgi:hypothetical protein
MRLLQNAITSTEKGFRKLNKKTSYLSTETKKTPEKNLYKKQFQPPLSYEDISDWR